MRRVREGPGRPIDNDVRLAAGWPDLGPKGDRARFPGYDQAVTAATAPDASPANAAGPGDTDPAPASPSTRGSLLLSSAVAVLAGVAGFLAFPPVGFWPAAIVSIAALTLLCRHESKRRVFCLGALYGLAFFLPLLTWIRTIGDDAWVLLSVVLALEYGLVALGLRLVSRLPGWPLWSAGVWVLAEALRGRFPLGGFTWGRWAFSQSDSPTLHLAAWGGAALVSFAVALCGSLLAAAVLTTARTRAEAGSARRPLALAAGALLAILAIVAVPLAIGLPTHGQTAHGPASVTAALVQGNVPRLGLDFNAQRGAVTATTTSRPPSASAATSRPAGCPSPTSSSGRRTPPTSTHRADPQVRCRRSPRRSPPSA